MNTIRRRNLPILVLAAAAFAVCAPPVAKSDESLANYVGPDTGLFVEVRDAGDLLLALSEPAVWQTLAEWAGQPVRLEDVADWGAQVRATVKMTPAEAINALFARRVAFVGDGIGHSQDGVVICRPTAGDRLLDLVRSWGAKPLPAAGRAAIFRLSNGIAAAVQDGLLILGDAGGAQTLFRRVLPFVEPQPPASLAQDASFLALLERVPQNPDGVLYARLGATPTTRPASAVAGPPPKSISELPGPLRGASRILLALHREGQFLHFSAVGDAEQRIATGNADLLSVAERLPERTLLAWLGHVDYPGLYQAVDELPPRNVLRQALKIQEKLQSAARLTDALGSATCVAVGVADPVAGDGVAPPLPGVALLIQASQPDEALRALDALADSTLTVYRLLALRWGWPALPAVQDLSLGGVEARVLAIGEIVRAATGVESPLHLCWALDRDVLVIASQPEWLRQVVQARRGQARTLERGLRVTQRPISPKTETIVVVQSGPLADLGTLWLEHLGRVAPEALQEHWWRTRQPGGGPRLGISVEPVPGQRRVRVTEVTAAEAADGILRVGDEIVGANGRPFATTQPVAEIQTAISQRPNARWIDLQVHRGGAALPTARSRVPLAFVDPVHVLRRMVALGRLAQRVVYYDDAPDPVGPRGFLTVELRRSQEPLFDFAPEGAPMPVAPPERP